MNRIRKTFRSGASLTLLALVTALGGSSGCQTRHESDGAAAERFLAEDETSAVTRLADQQTAAGARTDATLRSYHFDQAGLNSLGREKLEFMLADDDQGDELVVYLDLYDATGDRRVSGARRDDVAEYLTSHGVADGEFRLESGANPNNTFLASSSMEEEKPADDGGIFEMIGALMGAAAGAGPK